MKNLPLLIGTILGTIILVIVLAVAFSSGGTSPSDQVVPDEQLVTANSHIKGAAESAKVTIVEFSDLQCPACRAAQPLVQKILNQYPNDVRLAYRHYPLDSIHPNARAAGVAAEAAAQEGKFWEMHDLLFDNQPAWAEIRDRGELNEKFAEYAQQLQIDKTSFLEKIESDQAKAKVQEDTSAAQQLGISATPTFFVNGRQTPAPQLESTVQSIIDGSNTAQ
jgi:protein-disulfide isomerase